MTVAVSQFRIEDYREIECAPGADDGFSATEEQVAHAAKTNRHFYTIRIGNKVVALLGVVEYWPGRGEACAIFDKSGKDNFLTIHKVAKRWLESAPFRRIEATVVKGFKGGHRWAEMLGFQLEAETLRSFSPTGKDYSLYARVK